MSKVSSYEPDDPKHADTLVLNRNEPCCLVQVVEVIAALKGLPIERITKVTYENSLKLLGLKNDSRIKLSCLRGITGQEINYLKSGLSDVTDNKLVIFGESYTGNELEIEL